MNKSHNNHSMLIVAYISLIFTAATIIILQDTVSTDPSWVAKAKSSYREACLAKETQAETSQVDPKGVEWEEGIWQR